MTCWANGRCKIGHVVTRGKGGSSHIDMVYVFVPGYWDAISRNLV